MDIWLANHRTGRCISTAISVLHEAAENARDAHRAEILLELENLVEDLIKLHRDVLELPGQRSTPPEESQEDLPF